MCSFLCVLSFGAFSQYKTCDGCTQVGNALPGNSASTLNQVDNAVKRNLPGSGNPAADVKSAAQKVSEIQGTNAVPCTLA